MFDRESFVATRTKYKKEIKTIAELKVVNIFVIKFGLGFSV